MMRLVPQSGIDLEAILVAVLNIHTPEAEAVHDLTKGVVVVVKLNRALNIEDNI